MARSGAEDARPATVADLKLLLRSLNEQNVDYLLIGGYALYALGYQRGTTDIDVLLPRSREQGERVRRALLVLPDKVSSELEPAWFEAGDAIRVADAFVVDLLFNAGGETYQSLLPYAVTIDFDGVPIRTLTLEGLLKTKQSTREKDQLDRQILERALEAVRTSGDNG